MQIATLKYETISPNYGISSPSYRIATRIYEVSSHIYQTETQIKGTTEKKTKRKDCITTRTASTQHTPWSLGVCKKRKDKRLRKYQPKSIK